MARKTRSKSTKKTSGKKYSKKPVGNTKSENTRLSGIDKIISQARELYNNKNVKETISLLDKIDKDSHFKNDNQKLEYYRLLSFTLANDNDLVKAEKAAKEGLKISPDDPDFYFALAFTSTAYNDYENCIKSGEKFLEIYKKNKKLFSKGGKYLCTGHIHLLYNYIGVAYKALKKFDKAEDSFKESIKVQPAFDHAYLNLAVMYQNLGRIEEGKKIVADGLKNASQVQELRLLEKSLKNHASVSACMIVKNEEELLPNCLESMRSWIDEIIIVDTGSTDRTVEIAKEYGAKVYYQEWEGNFSKHRNFSLSHATKDWIFVIDADEEFVTDDLPRLRKALNQDKYSLISVDVYNVDKNSGECSSSLTSPRFFRSEKGYRYDGIVHNQLKYDDNEIILRSSVKLKHYGYNLSPEKMEKKIERSKALLEKQLEEDPNNEFTHFNYAQLLRSSAKMASIELAEAILKHSTRAVELCKNSSHKVMHIQLQSMLQQVSALNALKRYEESEKIIQEALEIKPDYLDALFMLGETLVHQKRYEESEEAFKKYIEVQSEYDMLEEKLTMIQLFLLARHKAYHWLAVIREMQNDLTGAEHYYLKTLKEQEPYRETYLKLANIYLVRNEPDKAYEYLEKEIAANSESAHAHILYAEYYLQKNNQSVAMKHLQKADEMTTKNTSILRRAAQNWTKLEKFDMAVKVLEKARGVNPESPAVLKQLGEVYYDTNKFELCAGCYSKYLEIGDPQVNISVDLANCYFKLGKFTEAEEIYQNVLDSSDIPAATFRNLGLTKFHLNKFEEAVTYLKKYSEIAPDDIQITLAIGGILAQNKHHAEAIPYYEKYLTSDPHNIEALFGISECYLNLGHIDSAAIGYRQILQIKSDFKPAISRLAEIETAGSPA